jgi:hypothetical protein
MAAFRLRHRRCVVVIGYISGVAFDQARPVSLSRQTIQRPFGIVIQFLCCGWVR